MTASNTFNVLLQYTVVYCLIVAAILALRQPVRSIAGARWAYALWFALFVPVGFAVVPDVIVAESTLFQPPEKTLRYGAMSVAEIHPINSLALLAVVLWLVGAGINIRRTIQTGLRTSRALKPGFQPLTTEQYKEIDRFCRRAGVFPPPEVRLSPGVSGTAVIGLFTPALLLPCRFFGQFTRSEQELMVRHELAHIQRKDPWWNMLFCALRCVFWFNPLIRPAERGFRLDQELSCDQFVLWEAPLAERACYARAMLKVATPRPSNQLIGFRSRAPEILRRTAMIEHHRKTVPQLVFGFIVFATLVASVSAVSASPPQYPSLYSATTSGWCTTYRALRQQ